MDGDVYGGSLFVDFRQTLGNRSGSDSNDLVVSLDGNTVRCTYVDGNGKSKMKTFKEKQIKSLRIVDPEGLVADELYVRLDYIEEPVLKKKGLLIDRDGSVDLLGSGMSLLRGTPKEKSKSALVYVVSDNVKTTLYFFNKSVFITDKGSGRTILINPESYMDQLSKIANGCDKVLNNVATGMYDYARDSFVEFVADLELCE